MQLSLVSDDGQVVSARCVGDIRDDDIRSSSQRLEPLLGPAGFARKMLLDLRDTTFIDSSGIAWLLTAHKRFKQAGGRLVLHRCPSSVNQVIQFLHLDNVLLIAADETDGRTMALAGQA